MPIKSICERDVITVRQGLSVYETAKIIKDHNVGNVVVVDDLLVLTAEEVESLAKLVRKQAVRVNK